MEIGGLSLSGTQFSGESTSSPVLINVHNKIGAGSEMVRKQQPPPRGVPGKPAQRPHGGGKAKAFTLPGEPIGMTRAKSWSPEVEEAFRLQEAGHKGVPSILRSISKNRCAGRMAASASYKRATHWRRAIACYYISSALPSASRGISAASRSTTLRRSEAERAVWCYCAVRF